MMISPEMEGHAMRPAPPPNLAPPPGITWSSPRGGAPSVACACFRRIHVIMRRTAMRRRKSPPTATDIPMMEEVGMKPRSTTGRQLS